MNITYRLTIDHKSQTELIKEAEAFAIEFAAYRKDKTCFFITDNSSVIAVAKKLKQLLQQTCTGLTFETLKSNSDDIFYCMTIHNILQTPVYVANARQVNKVSETPEIYFVGSDGRYYLNKEGFEELQKMGIAFYNSISAEGKAHPVRKEIIISDLIIGRFLEHTIKGMDKINNMTIVLNEEHSVVTE